MELVLHPRRHEGQTPWEILQEGLACNARLAPDEALDLLALRLRHEFRLESVDFCEAQSAALLQSWSRLPPATLEGMHKLAEGEQRLIVAVALIMARAKEASKQGGC